MIFAKIQLKNIKILGFLWEGKYKYYFIRNKACLKQLLIRNESVRWKGNEIWELKVCFFFRDKQIVAVFLYFASCAADSKRWEVKECPGGVNSLMLTFNRHMAFLIVLFSRAQYFVKCEWSGGMWIWIRVFSLIEFRLCCPHTYSITITSNAS